jgi:hypothetical protein
MYPVYVYFDRQEKPYTINFSNADSQATAFDQLSVLLSDPTAVWHTKNHTIVMSKVRAVAKTG